MAVLTAPTTHFCKSPSFYKNSPSGYNFILLEDSFLHQHSTESRHHSALTRPEIVPIAEPGEEPQLVLLTAHSRGTHGPTPHLSQVTASAPSRSNKSV